VVDTRADVLNIHADDCPGDCPRWLATGAPTCMPYPCRCDETKAAAPDWKRQMGDVTCWWRNRAGALTSRCPCWGDNREGKPETCCSWHLASPAYLDDRHAAFLALLDDVDAPGDPATEAALDAAMDHAKRPEPDPLVWDDERPYEAERIKREPFIRRWKPEELICEHDVTMIKGIHCVQCHIVYANEMVFGMHRAVWGQPCRTPDDLRDVDTGVPLVQQRSDGAWALDFTANLHLWEAAKHRAKQQRRAA